MLSNQTLDKIKKCAGEGKTFKQTLEELANDNYSETIQRQGIKLSAEFEYMKQTNVEGNANE